MQYIEAFTRAQRERFVAEFITKGVKKLLEDLEPTFAKVANGDAAKKLVRSKVTSAISSRAENFIIEGTTPHLSVEAHLEIASYEVGGETTEYVVGVDVRDAQTLGTHVSKD